MRDNQIRFVIFKECARNRRLRFELGYHSRTFWGTLLTYYYYKYHGDCFHRPDHRPACAPVGELIRRGRCRVASNIDNSPEYVAHVRSPENRYLSLPFRQDVELSMRPWLRPIPSTDTELLCGPSGTVWPDDLAYRVTIFSG
jgi:hypothetical protein